MDKLTIKEVYRKIMEKGDKYEDMAKKYLREKQEEEAERFFDYAHDYYECASWLERTEELNPTK